MGYNAKKSPVRNIYLSDTRIETIDQTLPDVDRKATALKDAENWSKKGYKRLTEYEEIEAFFGDVLASTLFPNVQGYRVVLLVREDSLVYRIFDDEKEREEVLNDLLRSEERVLIEMVQEKYKKRICPVFVEDRWVNFELTLDGEVPKFDKNWDIIYKDSRTKVIVDVKNLNTPTIVVPVYERIDIDSVPVGVIKTMLQAIRKEDELGKSNRQKPKTKA